MHSFFGFFFKKIKIPGAPGPSVVDPLVDVNVLCNPVVVSVMC